MGNKIVSVALCAAVMAAAPARAACWDEPAMVAAKVRDLQSMLMVATLRCQASGQGSVADYNGFVAGNRDMLTAMNSLLKSHFITPAGAGEGQRDYDRFTTALANRHGADAPQARPCVDIAALAREAQGMANDLDGLIHIAEREGIDPVLPGGSCAARDRFDHAVTAMLAE